MRDVPRVAVAAFAWLILVSSAYAQAEQMLMEAYQRLLDAGNYEWRETLRTDFDGTARNETRGWGATMVNGYTVATIAGNEGVFLGTGAVFQLRAGWRHVGDFTEDEYFELAGRRAAFFMKDRGGSVGFRRYTYIPVHDLLGWLLNQVQNIRLDGNVVIGDLPADIDGSLRNAKLPVTPQPNLASLLLRKRTPKFPPNKTATLAVWLSSGNIEEFACEFAVTMPSRLNDGKPLRMREEFVFKLSKLGAAKVNVPPQVKVLLEAR